MIFDSWDEACAIWRAALTASGIDREKREDITKKAKQIYRDAFFADVLGLVPSKRYASMIENGEAKPITQFVVKAIEDVLKGNNDEDDGC